MKIKLTFLTNLFIISTLTCFAQASKSAISLVRDTIFVYDTLYVTDTVFVKKTPIKQIKMEALPTLSTPAIDNAFELSDTDKFLIFSADGTATLFQNSIINVDNINQSEKIKAMKKLKFIGLMVFAFQNMVLAQNDIGITVGGGVHNIVNIFRLEDEVDERAATQATPTFNIGVNYRRALGKKGLFLDATFNYNFLPKTFFNRSNLIKLSEKEIYFGVDALGRINDDFDEHYHLVSLPLVLHFNFKKIKPGIGIEPYLKSSSAIWSIANRVTTHHPDGTTTVEYNVPTYYVNAYVGASIVAAVQVPISDLFHVTIKYAKGINNEYVGYKDFHQHTTKIQRMDVSLRYKFGGK